MGKCAPGFCYHAKVYAEEMEWLYKKIFWLEVMLKTVLCEG